MMMLVLRVQRAIRLKKIIRLVSGIHQRGQLTIREDGLFLQAMNPEHGIPAAVTLCSSWFQSYILFAPTYDPSWTIEFDLQSFHFSLGFLNNDEELEIYLILGFDQKSDCFYVLHQQDGLPYIREMEFQRSSLGYDLTSYQNDIEHSYGFGFRVLMRPNHFVNVVQRTIEPPRPIFVSIAKLVIMISSGETKRFLSQGPYCLIEHFPNGKIFSLLLSLHKADYCIEAASIGRTMAISVPDRVRNPELPPVLCVLIDQSATIHFFIAWNSIVNPQLKESTA